MRGCAGVSLIVTILAGAVDIARALAAGGLTFTPLGLTWRTYHPSSLQQFEFGVQQYVSADLWFNTITPMLLLPTILFLAIFTLLFFLLSRAGRRKNTLNAGRI